MKIKSLFLLTTLAIGMLTACNNDSEKRAGSNPPAGKTDSLIAVKNLRDDLSILWSAIKELHPGYGIYTRPDSLQMAYTKTYAAIQKPLTESQFINLVYPFICNLRCGHTQIKHSEGYQRTVNEKTTHLPFEVLIRNHKAWITNHQTTQLTTGDELISMNGVPVAAIIDHGYDAYGDDGYNETFKELFLSEYDGFEDVCHNYYHWPGPYLLKLRTNSGQEKTIRVNASAHSVSDSSPKVDNYTNWTTAKSVPDSRLLFLKKPAVALFKSTPFAYADTLVFKEAFKLIKQKGIKTLIIDMRHNSGGDIRIATQLLSYLADKPF